MYFYSIQSTIHLLCSRIRCVVMTWINARAHRCYTDEEFSNDLTNSHRMVHYVRRCIQKIDAIYSKSRNDFLSLASKRKLLKLFHFNNIGWIDGVDSMQSVTSRCLVDSKKKTIKRNDFSVYLFLALHISISPDIRWGNENLWKCDAISHAEREHKVCDV